MLRTGPWHPGSQLSTASPELRQAWALIRNTRPPPRPQAPLPNLNSAQALGVHYSWGRAWLCPDSRKQEAVAVIEGWVSARKDAEEEGRGERISEPFSAQRPTACKSPLPAPSLPSARPCRGESGGRREPQPQSPRF